MRTWFRSLEGSLAVRLGLLYLIATAIAVGALVYQAYDIAASLNDRDLNLRASDLARYVVPEVGRGPRLDLPANLAAAQLGEGERAVDGGHSSGRLSHSSAGGTDIERHPPTGAGATAQRQAPPSLLVSEEESIWRSQLSRKGKISVST